MREIADSLERMARLQYRLYADAGQSLRVVLRALDAAGKDGVIGHLFTGMKPPGKRVFGLKRYELINDVERMLVANGIRI